MKRTSKTILFLATLPYVAFDNNRRLGFWTVSPPPPLPQVMFFLTIIYFPFNIKNMQTVDRKKSSRSCAIFPDIFDNNKRLDLRLQLELQFLIYSYNMFYLDIFLASENLQLDSFLPFIFFSKIFYNKVIGQNKRKYFFAKKVHHCFLMSNKKKKILLLTVIEC